MKNIEIIIKGKFSEEERERIGEGIFKVINQETNKEWADELHRHIDEEDEESGDCPCCKEAEDILREGMKNLTQDLSTDALLLVRDVVAVELERRRVKKPMDGIKK